MAINNDCERLWQEFLQVADQIDADCESDEERSGLLGWCLAGYLSKLYRVDAGVFLDKLGQLVYESIHKNRLRSRIK